ncbi:MAG: cell wall hydrolase [Velocimicrobium sp.]
MQEKHSFLLSAKNKVWLFAIIYCIMVVALVYSTSNAQAENKTTSVVYAQGKTRSASVDAIEETEENAQIQLAEEAKEQQELMEESAQAMQLELAEEIASNEKEKREIEESKIYLSKADTEILLRIVEAEATGEDIEGKMLVANVILNRVNSKKFPDTIEKVVFAKRQFSPIRDGRYYKVSITKDTKEAVSRVLNGEDQSSGAVYFMSRKKASAKNVSWFDNHLTKVTKHGTHEFFK